MTLDMRIWLAIFMVVCGCGSPQVNTVGALHSQSIMSSYQLDLDADQPLAHWRISGLETGAIAGAQKGSRSFKLGQSQILRGADIGGDELSVELWLKNAQGTVLRYMGAEGDQILALTMTPTVRGALRNQAFDTAVNLKEDTWQHLGFSWRGSRGELKVTIDGQVALDLKVTPQRPLPFGGFFILGGEGGALL